MQIIGELINVSRKSVSDAVKAKNADYIKLLAQEQYDAGADYIDVNCGTMLDNEVEVMEWLVNTIQDQVEAPLCIDSPNPLALDAGLALCKYGRPMLNSISDEDKRFDLIMPIIQKHQPNVVALCMDGTGMPETAQERMKVVKNLYNKLTKLGVEDDQIYFDPLVKPVSSVGTAGIEVLETIKEVKLKYPNVHLVCGLSNISYGLPNRKFLNGLFVVQTMVLGMDGYVLDPTDKNMMGTIIAAKTLLGKDDFNSDYLYAYRKGMYE